jgi:hypothetical protein
MLVILLLIDSCYSRLRGFYITETRRLVRQSFFESSGQTGCFALHSLRDHSFKSHTFYLERGSEHHRLSSDTKSYGRAVADF